MTVKLKNNAVGYLSAAISSSDSSATLTTGGGAAFPSLGAGDYFYATITATSGVYEIVKVTSRSTDAISITRAQEGTTALSFPSGSIVELRVTSQAITDAIADQIDTLEADVFAAAGTGTSVGLNIGSGKTLNATNGTILLPAVTVPAQTTDGSIAWDSDNELLTVGTGSTRKTLVDIDTVQTLSNKTLSSPIISTISNTGTLTLPTSTDTLVGRATTDTLLNKTLTSPTISGPTISGTLSGAVATFSSTLGVTGAANLSSTLAVSGATTLSSTLGVTGTTTFSGAAILAAGTTSLAPLRFTSGTNLTTPTAGVFEYDGAVFYGTPTANNRGLAPVEHFIVLTSANNLDNSTAAQALFDGGGGPTNGSITLPVGTYFFECSFSLTGMSTTSGSFGFGFGGTATISQTWTALASRSTATTLATLVNAEHSVNTATNSTIATASTGTTGRAYIKGIVRVTVAGTLIPQTSTSVGSATPAAVSTNSYFTIKQLGNSSVVSVGNWG
jgi:hypothetical protein